MTYKKLRIIISGGGTGGHIFPAISIASRLKQLNPENVILFVGAEGRMEMEKVPAAGFEIKGLPIVGIQRRLSWANLKNNIQVPFKLLSSLRKAGRIIDRFHPDVAIGVGGYASAPLLRAATRRGIPALIQEQNGFAGLTNKMLASKVQRICVAYEGMERFFPADRIILTGNPSRADIHPHSEQERSEALAFYGFTPGKKHLLILGGSLGSKTLNDAMRGWIKAGCPGGEDVEVLWQCGRYYLRSTDYFMQERNLPGIHWTDFIARMDYAYAAADVVISRSGASSVSELCAVGKATVFVPSPNVAEDHQTHNAMALVRHDAALLVRDADAQTQLFPTAMELLHDPERRAAMERNIRALARPDAADAIAQEVYKLV